MPNATLAQLQEGWVGQPDTRGSMDIVTSCLSAILICLWTMLHMNIPYPDEPWWKIMRRKLAYLGLAIVVPEYIACMAGGQWAGARRSVKAMRDIGNDNWTMTHGFYTEMGGFVLEDHYFPPFRVTTSQICYLVRNQYMEMPDITIEEIQDKCKADGATKVLAFLHTGRVLLEIIARAAQGLPLTLLELETCAIVVCSLFSFYFWFSKPMDIGKPTKLHAKISIAEMLIRAGDEAKRPHSHTPLDFVECPDPLMKYFEPKEGPILPISENQDVPDDTVWMYILYDLPFLPIIIIQFLGWNFHFPTMAEQLLWRWGCIVYTATFISYSITETVVLIFAKEPQSFMQRTNSGKRKWPYSIAAWSSILVATAARMCVLIEIVISFRALPIGCFHTVNWLGYLPRIFELHV